MQYFFYIFSTLIVFFCLSAILFKNPVHSVLSLIAAFLNTSLLFILFSAEFMAMVLAIVYVGAIAILFLFVVMMLNIARVCKEEGFLKRWMLGSLMGTIFVAAMFILAAYIENNTIFTANLPPLDTRAIADILYSEYLIAFEIVGAILLSTMVGSIYLTIYKRKNVKRQSYSAQLSRLSTIKLVKVASFKGVNLDD